MEERLIYRQFWMAPLGVFMMIGALSAAELSLTFDDARPSWQPLIGAHQGAVLRHERTQSQQRRGDAAEHILVRTNVADVPIHFDHKLPSARPIEDLVLSLWVRCNQPSLQVSLRLVFPGEKDPATGRTLVTWIPGGQYTHIRDWQHLTATSLQKQVREQMFVLRQRLRRPELQQKNLYVDQVRLTVKPQPGLVDLVIDDLNFGPIVSPAPGTHIVQGTQAKSIKSTVEFRSHRLIVDGHPFLPCMMPWHGEKPETLRAIGINVAYVPDYRDSSALDRLKEQGIWSMATPPRAASSVQHASAGGRPGVASSSLMPFSEATAPVLFWYPGTNIPSAAKDQLIEWNRQVRAADRTRKRPISADVIGNEKVFSRHVDLLGLSRHILHRDIRPIEYRDSIIARRRKALPWSLAWTWVDCEPDPQLQQRRLQNGLSAVVVEPEQIRMQVYAALSAGCRGVGFWKQSSLEEKSSRETMLQISQLCMELRLLEPFIASGQLESPIPFRAGMHQRATVDRGPQTLHQGLVMNSRQQMIIRAQTATAAAKRANQVIHEAAVIRHDHGVLLLPMAFDPFGQFVPDANHATNVTVTVPGVPAAASAWEVTPTRIRSLQRTATAGGLKITIPEFDQTTAVLVTSNRELITELQQIVEKTAGASAWLEVELLKTKFARVSKTETELRSLTVGNPESSAGLAYVQSLLNSATESVARREYHRARQLARQGGSALRSVQRKSWNHAVRNHSGPSASENTLCYQTLPEHWKVASRLARIKRERSFSPNLLHSGSFEDISTVDVEGWKNVQAVHEDLVIRTDLAPSSLPPSSLSGPGDGELSNRYCLRMEALPRSKSELPLQLEQPPIVMTSPGVTVRQGQTIEISGWYRVVVQPRRGKLGVTIEGTQLPTGSGLHLRAESEWTRFRIIRQAHRTEPFRVQLALHGLGIVEFDNLTVRTIDTGSDE